MAVEFDPLLGQLRTKDSGGATGQTIYNIIVAATGGDYTTLGAALAVANNGDTILIKSPTTEIGDITCSKTNLTIVGTNNNITIGLSTYTLTLSGAGVTVQNLGFSLTTGQLASTGNNQYFLNCLVSVGDIPSHTTGHVYVNGQYTILDALQYSTSVPGTTRSHPSIYFNQYYQKLINSAIEVSASGADTGANACAIRVATSGPVNIINNTFYSSGNNEALVIYNQGRSGIISSNIFYGLEATLIQNTGNYVNICSNTWVGGIDLDYIIYNTGSYVNINNNNLQQPEYTTCIYSTGSLVTINNNYIEGSKADGSMGIYVNGQSNIEGNILSNHATGISVGSSSTGTVINDNIISNFTTAISDSGAGTIKLNNGSAGDKLTITTGTNASAGTGTLVGGTATISTTAVTANSVIFLQDTSSSTTNVGVLTVSSKTAGTSFVVTSTIALDTSTFNYLIVN